MKPSRRTLSDALRHAALPVAAGAAVYLLWRSPRLPVFRLMEALGMDAAVAAMRVRAAGARTHLPDAVLFALPDGLWVYALTAALALVWRGRRGWAGAACVSLGLVLGLGSEAAQALGALPGTFDWMDAALALALVYGREGSGPCSA